jgi:hypothetical protein
MKKLFKALILLFISLNLLGQNNSETEITVGTVSGETTFCSSDGWIELIGLPEGGIWTGSKYLSGKFFNTDIAENGQTSFDLTYTYKEKNGDSSSKTLTITVRPKPEVIIDKTANYLCYPEQYNVSATYGHADGILWFKDNDSASGNFSGSPSNTLISYNPAWPDLDRLYFVLYIQTTHSDNVCPPDYDTIKVNMSAIPVANFYFDFPYGQKNLPLEVKFLDTSTITLGKIVKWNWDFGDGRISNQRSPFHIYPLKGYYYVNLTVQSHVGCKHSIMKVLKIKENGVGIPDNKSDDINIYPNPSNGIFTIESSGIAEIEIYNLNGQIVYSNKHLSGQENFQVNLSNQPKGLFLVKFISNQGKQFYEEIILE